LGRGQASLAIAYLGQVLRANPSNQVAANRLVSALVHRRFPAPLTEPLRHEFQVISAQFSPDGQRVVTASQDKTARVWEIPVASLPLSVWFIKRAEATAGRRFDAQGMDAAVPALEARQQREQAAARTDTNFFTRVAQWAQADAGLRSISPFSPITAPEYVTRRIQENTLASLREAVLLSPTNSLAFARLAMRVKDQSAKENPGHLEEAEFYARYALEHDPNNSEARQALNAIQLEKDQRAKGRGGPKP